MVFQGLYEPLTHERAIVFWWWWWCCKAFPVLGEVSQWPFSSLAWGTCTDFNGWFNLNLTTVTRLLACIKQWTLFAVYIVKCFCMLGCRLAGTYSLAGTLCLYSAGMPIQCSTFQGRSTVFRGHSYLHNFMFGNNKLCWQNSFEKFILQCSEGSWSWKYNPYFPVNEVAKNMKDYIVNRVDGVVEQKNLKLVFHKH